MAVTRYAKSMRAMADGMVQSEPRGNPAQDAGAFDADCDSNLTARGSRQKLAERHDVRVRPLVQPAAPFDEFLPEIAEMRHRPAEGGQPQPPEHREHFEKRTPTGLLSHRAAPWRRVYAVRRRFRPQMGIPPPPPPTSLLA